MALSMALLDTSGWWQLQTSTFSAQTSPDVSTTVSGKSCGKKPLKAPDHSAPFHQFEQMYLIEHSEYVLEGRPWKKNLQPLEIFF